MRIWSFLLTIICFQTHAQFFAGLGTDPNNGIYALNTQPAFFTNKVHKWQLALPGVDFTLRKAQLRQNERLFASAFEFDVDRIFDFDNNDSQLFANLIIPGITYSPSNKHIFGFSLNLRGYSYTQSSESNVSKFLEQVIETGEVPEDFLLVGGYSKAFVNTWLEAKFNYARVLHRKGRHKLTGGAALKFLQGAASGYFELDELQVQGGSEGIENLEAKLKLVYNRELDQLADNETLEMDLFKKSSIGLDLGVQYFLFDDPEDERTNDYRLSVGFNVTDIGSMAYQPSNESADYVLEGSDLTLDFVRTAQTLDAFVDSLENKLSFTSTKESDYRLSLPTRYSLAIDYRLMKNLWISAIPSYYPVSDQVFTRESAIFNVLVTPRFHWKRLTMYVPMYASNRIRDVYGLTLQYGFVAVGSSNFWNIAVGGERNLINAFVSMTFRINQKKLRE